MGLLDPPWTTERRVLETSLSPEQCRKCLAPFVAYLIWPWSSQPLRGSVGRNGFRVSKAIRQRNSFQTEAVGKCEATSDGTRVSIRLGMSPFVVAFICLWCAVLGLLAMLLFVATIGAARSMSDFLKTFMPVAVFAGMAVFGFLLQVFGRWLARSEADFLIHFLEDTLQAHEVAPD